MITIEHLRMEYDQNIAIENLNLHIGKGEVFGLIGPNGAGKTTLIRILSTLLEPTYGSVEIDGVDVLSDPLRVHPLIGYMSDFFSLYENMRVWEYLDHFARCYRIAADRRQRLIDEALELVTLEVRRDAEISELSRGMRQRLCFAKSLLHEPQVLLLDEPASGLDPAGRVEFREMIKQLHQMNRTVVISSHILTEMTEFCTSIGILEQGRLLASGKVADVQRLLQPELRLRIEILGEIEKLLTLLSRESSVEILKKTESQVDFIWSADRDSLPELHRQIVAEGVPLVSFSVDGSNLEDLYMRIAQHKPS